MVRSDADDRYQLPERKKCEEDGLWSPCQIGVARLVTTMVSWFMTDDHDPGDYYDRNETAQTGASPQKARPIKRLAVTSLSQWRPR